MGNLLKILSNNCLDSSPGFSEEIFLDFDNVIPKEDERQVYNTVSPILAESQDILRDLTNYEGAAAEIKKCIQSPSDQEHKDHTWNTLLPLVVRLKRYFEFSSALTEAYIDIIRELTRHQGSATHQLEQKQALARQLGDLIHFTLNFDKKKMENSQIQNDYSFFRRLTNFYSRMKDVRLPGEKNEELTQAQANDISFFYAKPTPMLSILSEATVKFVDGQNEDVKLKTLTILSTFANITKTMIEKNEFRSKLSTESIQLCERVMTAAIILYDHVHPNGAFEKKSAIDVKGAIKLLLSPDENNAMLNALRYTTKTINSDSTQKQIKQLLEVRS